MGVATGSPTAAMAAGLIKHVAGKPHFDTLGVRVLAQIAGSGPVTNIAF